MFEYEAAKQQLRTAAEAYYTDGTSTMSDADYDALLREVSEYEAAHGLTEDVAGEAIASGAAIGGGYRHDVPMLSLDNVYDHDSLDRWMSTLGDDPAIVVEPKLDGLAMSIHYEQGQPTRMVTRGDGVTGEDVSRALSLIADLPHGKRFSGELRGEVIFSHQQFEDANAARVASGKAAFANARNAAAGTVNRAARGGEVPKGTHLSFVVYDWVGAEDKWGNHAEAMHALADWGFTTALHLLTGDVSLEAKPSIDFDIDGVVYKVNDFEERRKLGFTSRAPRWARAFKYPPDVAITTLEGVLWQVGRTGAVTPRAVLQPVSVGGTTIRYATLNNPDDIKRKGLYLGARVEIRRAAEVIPEVMGLAGGQSLPSDITDKLGHRILSGPSHDSVHAQLSIDTPTHCPNCGEVLLTNEARLRCPSGGQCAIERKLTYATSRDALDIEGMSDALVEALVAADKLRTVADLFDLTTSDIANCPTGRLTKDGDPIVFGDTIAAKVKAELDRARKEATFDRVLIALGLAGTGRSLCKRIAAHYGSMDALLAATADDLATVDKVGAVKAASLYEQLHADAMLEVIDKLAEHGLAMAEAVSTGPQPLAGMTIVVTGTMRQLGSRSEVTSNLEALGATVAGSVSAKTTLVVADDPEGTSSKLVKARKLGVRIVDEDAFIREFGL